MDSIFELLFPGFGLVKIRPFDVKRDCKFLHNWVNQEYAHFWGMAGMSLAQVETEYFALAEPEHYNVYVGEFQGEAAFVLESYDPRQDIIGEHYAPLSGDCGMHLICAPRRDKGRRNFTWHMFGTSLDFLFKKSSIERVLVEPDIRNRKMFTLCERVGFVFDRVVELPHKTAQLGFVTRVRHQTIRHSGEIRMRSAMNNVDIAVSPRQAVKHISQSRWHQANLHLVQKAICEFSHERLLSPQKKETTLDGFSRYELESESGTKYSFQAKQLPLDHLSIQTQSLFKHTGTGIVDAVAFIKEFRKEIGISDALLPLYLEEVLSTLQGATYKAAKGNPSAAQLVHADFQTIEQSMTEGHPAFVANNGRIGFDASDYRAYAPEAGNSFSLIWLAGHRRRAVYSGLDSLPYDKLINQQLDEQSRAIFRRRIEAEGYDPDDYLMMPIHPWQWFNKLATIFASEVASGDLICLGYGSDQYVAQQSVRTLFNASNPQKFYTKSALSILNMGFMRGLPLYYLGTAPVMATWLEERLYNDPFICETGFRMLSEVASVSYVNPYFEEFGPHNDYNKMLASLWRESPESVLKPGQKAITMAALLHEDDQGSALLPAFISESGLTVEVWLACYLDAYLTPLLHCFYAHDLVFMPHGENVILVMENHVPIRSLMKDITEEAAILSTDVELPSELKRMFVEVPEDVKLLSIFIDIFDGFLRYVSNVLEVHDTLAAAEFWGVVADRVKNYQSRFPELKAKFKQYDLFAPEFTLSCLNRLQIRNHRQMIDLDEPVGRLQFQGKIANPLAEN